MAIFFFANFVHMQFTTNVFDSVIVKNLNKVVTTALIIDILKIVMEQTTNFLK